MKLERFKERDNKRIGIIVFTVSCILLVAGVFFFRSFALFEEKKNFNVINGVVTNPGDLYFAYYVDDVITFEIPKKGSGYTLSSKSSCNNGVTITWDKTEWTATINYQNYEKGNSSRTKCNLYFEKEVTAKDYILSKVIEGQIVEDDGTVDHNLRYIGANPNNYVTFNNELWRIIGSFNNIDDGSGNKETRIKLIRNESIGEFSWDTSPSNINNGDGVNEWSQADAMKLLNPGYESESVGGSLYWNRTSGTCYNGTSNSTTPCDFTNNGLSTVAKNMVKTVKWNTGTYDGVDYTDRNLLTNKYYEIERSSNTGKICTTGNYCNDTVTRTTAWVGNIGLIYPSDYGYATSGGITTNRETCLNTSLYNWENSNAVDCINNNWLFKSGIRQYTIISGAYEEYNSTACLIFSDGVNHNGSVICEIAANGMEIFPSLFLKSNVKITNGDGSETSPFILSLE